MTDTQVMSTVHIPNAYYVKVADQQLGPLTVKQLLDLQKSGTIALQDAAIAEGMADWARVGDILGAFEQLAAKRDVQVAPPPLASTIKKATYGARWALGLGLIALVFLALFAKGKKSPAARHPKAAKTHPAKSSP